MKQLIGLSFLIFALSFSPAGAEVRLPHILCDNMVVQQQSDVRLWGWAEPGRKVTATVSWSKERSEAKADADGKWLLTVHSPKASYTPLTITFDDGQGKVSLSNVLAGEVWVCAGQSNMEMPMRGFDNCQVENYAHHMLNAAGPNQVRSVKIPAVMSATPLDDADCEWRECCPQTVGDFSATGYLFARLVNQVLDIPVGLIEANKGGTRVESWLSKENLERYTDEPTDSAAIVKKWRRLDYYRAMLWGNGTFSPITNYTVKGILFYQGCSNVGNPGNQYSERLKLLVEQWRSQFALGEIPFYFVQICPFLGGTSNGGDLTARIMEQQQRAQAMIANSALVSTNDCVYPYESNQIPPCQKQKIGERLAFIALNKQYGQTHIPCEAPRFRELTVEDDTAILTFDHMDGGVNRLTDIVGFELAGDDHVYHPANATFSVLRNRLQLTSPDVPKPVAVRYCFSNWQLGNFGNAMGLPLFPFRTDNW